MASKVIFPLPVPAGATAAAAPLYKAEASLKITTNKFAACQWTPSGRRGSSSTALTGFSGSKRRETDSAKQREQK